MLLLFAVLSVAVHAEPDSSVRYLTNEPVSLLEWGIYRLQNNLNTAPLDIPKQMLRVDYDWSKNQLLLHLAVYPSFESLQKTPAKAVCESVVHKIKAHFGVERGYEILRPSFGIGTFFHPQYFEKNNTPKTLDFDIEKITNIEVKVMTSKNDQAPFKQDFQRPMRQQYPTYRKNT